MDLSGQQRPPSPGIGRRAFCQTAGWGLLAGAAGVAAGCGGSADQFGRLDKVWGRRGVVPGRLQRPRAMAIDRQDRLFIVDFLARIHVFDADGRFLQAWQTPTHANGKPTGITVQDDRLLVADTHYYRVLPYTLEGELVEEEILGGVNGPAPGQFGLVTDAVRDSTGALYVSEYGGYDRVQKFSPTGEHLLEWGQHGAEPGQFNRPQNLLIDPQDRIWVCDACNHRIQVFSTQGELLFLWGAEGAAPGRLSYPYDIAMDGRGVVYLCEYGNHRVQRFTQDGQPLGCWGRQGRGPGEMHNPWSLVLDSRGRMHVLDTYNHRVQRVVV
ncbi:MAG: NHL repeat-containing protein [Planctomycetota bacterium]